MTLQGTKFWVTSRFATATFTSPWETAGICVTSRGVSAVTSAKLCACMLMAPPDDNPFVDIPGAAAAVWSYGHRNPQGLTVNAQTGELWSHEHEDLEPPVHYWEPSIAPSDMLFYDGDAFPGWRGNLFVGTLAGRHISRLVHDGTKVISEEQLLADPHGSLYFGVDAGDILRLVPVKR